MSLKKLMLQVSVWWNGKWYQNDPDDNFFYFGRVYHPTAISARKVVAYLKKEHKFVVSTLLGIIGISIAYAIK